LGFKTVPKNEWWQVFVFQTIFASLVFGFRGKNAVDRPNFKK
jgi:hypothetical protein